ncbi:MAG: vWA domain-containing protein [Candidatus Spyradocola sp.]|jgi:uncharacterized protein YegL
MSNYEYGDYREVMPENLNDPHMPVLFLLDHSTSMDGPAIQNLNREVNKFPRDICRDARAARCVEVAVVGFNGTPHVLQNWRPVDRMEEVHLVADGWTDLSAALKMGVDMLRERSHVYQDIGLEVKMPYLILVTDCCGGDVSEIASVIQRRTKEHKMQLWVLAVQGYDKKTAAVLTNGERIFELKDESDFDFSEFFNLMKISAKAISASAPGQNRVTVKSDIGGPNSNMRVPDLDAWMNP